ncbi:MAG TPA: hypothetical protein VKG67_06230 [Gallionellaceae bacterium]|nr:hypothetical protein [Gallionellaceae bacterium]
MMRGMVIDMEEARLQTLAQVRAFLDGTTEVAFRIPKAERNSFIERVLKRFGHSPHGKADKSVLPPIMAVLCVGVVSHLHLLCGGNF